MPAQALPLQKRQALPCVLTREEVRRAATSWLLDSKIRQLSPNTLYSRKLVTDKLLWFLEQNDLETCGVTEIKQFLAYISTAHQDPEGRWGDASRQKEVRPSTIAMYYARLRTLYAYLVDEGTLEASPFAAIKHPVCRDDQVQPFTPTQVNALLHAATQSVCPKRNRAILLFLLDTGVRASELCSLLMRDVDLMGQKATVLGKGNKRRVVFYGRNTSRALIAYLKEDEHELQEPLFFAWDETRSRAPLTRSGLRQLIQRLGKTAGIEAIRCSPHTFRHTFAIEFLKNGGNTFSLQTLLGHTSLVMTRRYTALAQADIENQHRQYSPADRLKVR